MKKFFTLLLALTTTAVFAQQLVLETDTSYATGDPNFIIECSNHVLNSTSGSVNLKWTRTEVMMPSGWLSQVCDKNNCYNPPVSIQSFVLAPNENGALKVKFIPNGPGTSMVKLDVNSIDNSNLSTTAYFVATASGSNSVKTQEIKDLLLYPTPVRENMQVVFKPTMKPQRIEIFNVLGQKVKVFPVQLEPNNYRMELQLSDLDKGMYFLRLYQSGTTTVVTKQFTKE